MKYRTIGLYIGLALYENAQPNIYVLRNISYIALISRINARNSWKLLASQLG